MMGTLRAFGPLLILAGCQGGAPVDDGPAPDREATVEPLELPDTSDIDFVAAYTDALSLALTVNASAPWAGHVAAIELRQDGCPDLWSGAPEDADLRDALGTSWQDHCDTAGGLYYDGFTYWESDILVTGDRDAPEGITFDATRTLVADGVVGEPDGVVFELDGTATDSTYLVEGEGFTSWTYSSLVEGTVTGTASFPDGSLTPEGWRTDLYLYMTGGDFDRLEARGNVYLFDGRLHERFDSMAMDLELLGPGSAGPEDCALEPLGWIGLRDENAYWYDLVFLPRYDDDVAGEDYPNDPLSECDGCGTLYVRGVESGEVCLDFSSMFDGRFTPPEIAEYILTVHDLP